MGRKRRAGAQVTQLESLIAWHAQKLSVSEKHVPEFKRKLQEKEAKQKVDTAVNRWLYQQ